MSCFLLIGEKIVLEKKKNETKKDIQNSYVSLVRLKFDKVLIDSVERNTYIMYNIYLLTFIGKRISFFVINK